MIEDIELYDPEEILIEEVLLNIPPLRCQVYENKDGKQRLKIPESINFEFSPVVESKEEKTNTTIEIRAKMEAETNNDN